MSNWKYTDSTNTKVFRTNPDGSGESCFVEAIADWIAEGNIPLPADPIIVPPITEVTMRQARAALIVWGSNQIPAIDLLSQVDTAINSMVGVDGLLAQNDWIHASTIKRDYPLLITLANQLGWTNIQLDELFKLASTL